MLAARRLAPELGRHDLELAEHVLGFGMGPQAAPVHPGAEVGRDGDVGRRRHDAPCKLAVLRGDGVQDLAEAFLRARLLVIWLWQRRRNRHRRRRGPPLAAGIERRGIEEGLQLGRRRAEARELLPFLAVGDAHALLEARHLVERHQAGMVVLVPGEGQALALDRVGDETGRRVVGHAFEGIEHGLHVVAGEVGHQPVKGGIVVLLEDAPDAGILVEVAGQRLAPAGTALEDQRRVERVGAGVDPLPQLLAVGLGERRLQQLAVLQGDDAPADQLEHLADAAEQAIVDHAVEALAVVVDHPPEIAHIVLPAFEQGLEDVALVELGVADQGHHSTSRLLPVAQALQPDIVLYQRGEERHGDAQPHRAGGEIDVVDVLGARGVRLRAAQRPEAFQLLAGLMAEQVLDGVKYWRGVRLHRHAILRPQHREVEGRHHRRQRGAGGLMPADLQPVAIGPQMVGVMDRPGAEPQHLALELAQQAQPLDGGEGGHGHRHTPRALEGPCVWPSEQAV